MYMFDCMDVHPNNISIGAKNNRALQTVRLFLIRSLVSPSVIMYSRRVRSRDGYVSCRGLYGHMMATS